MTKNLNEIDMENMQSEKNLQKTIQSEIIHQTSAFAFASYESNVIVGKVITVVASALTDMINFDADKIRTPEKTVVVRLDVKEMGYGASHKPRVFNIVDKMFRTGSFDFKYNIPGQETGHIIAPLISYVKDIYDTNFIDISLNREILPYILFCNDPKHLLTYKKSDALKFEYKYTQHFFVMIQADLARHRDDINNPGPMIFRYDYGILIEKLQIAKRILQPHYFYKFMENLRNDLAHYAGMWTEWKPLDKEGKEIKDLRDRNVKCGKVQVTVYRDDFLEKEFPFLFKWVAYVGLEPEEIPLLLVILKDEKKRILMVKEIEKLENKFLGGQISKIHEKRLIREMFREEIKAKGGVR